MEYYITYNYIRYKYIIRYSSEYAASQQNEKEFLV